jgi:hypothetical protein
MFLSIAVNRYITRVQVNEKSQKLAGPEKKYSIFNKMTVIFLYSQKLFCYQWVTPILPGSGEKTPLFSPPFSGFDGKTPLFAPAFPGHRRKSELLARSIRLRLFRLQ